MGRIGAVAASGIWLIACAAAWEKSTTSGMMHRNTALEIAKEVGRASKLSPACTKLAGILAESSIKARTTLLRPTNRIMLVKEEEAIHLWEAGRCPVRALPGIAFGVAAAVRSDFEARYEMGGI